MILIYDCLLFLSHKYLLYIVIWKLGMVLNMSYYSDNVLLIQVVDIFIDLKKKNAELE